VKAVVLVLALIGVSGCGTTESSLRSQMDTAEASARAAENALDEADKRMDALDADATVSLLRTAKEKLADPNITKYPEHSLLKSRLAESETRLVRVKEDVAKRELERAVMAHRQMLEAAEKRLSEAVAGLKKPSVSDSAVSETKDAASDLEAQLERGEEVALRDDGLGEYAAGLKKVVAASRGEVEAARGILSFRSGPAAAREAGLDLLEEMRAADAEDAAGIKSKAIDQFQLCVVDGRSLIATTPELAKMKIELEGRVSTVEAVVAGCDKSLASLTKGKVAKAKPKASKKSKKAKKKKKR
jgi:hypothetical protein